MIGIFKIGNRVPGDTSKIADGQLVELRPDSAPITRRETEKFACIRFSGGDPDFSDPAIRSLVFSRDEAGKYPWDKGYDTNQRDRDKFIDLNALNIAGKISDIQLANFYDKSYSMNVIDLGISIDSILLDEDTHQRSDISKLLLEGSISSGSHTIGALGDYATIVTFRNDIITQTDDLIGLHLNEETACTVSCDFNHDVNGHQFTLTAQSGAAHDGTGYGNGARINMAGFDNIRFSGDCTDAEISKLQIDARQSSNVGLVCTDLTNAGGTIKAFRLLIIGDVNSTAGMYLYQGLVGNTYYFYNNIIYGFTKVDSAWNIGRGIAFHGEYASHNGTFYLFNNTIAKCNFNFAIYSGNNGNHTWKNNFSQGAVDTGYKNESYIDTHAKNISQDASSPDASYRSLNKQSVFTNYASDNYIIDTDDSDVDDGEDLSGTFTDDVANGDGRRPVAGTWDIGASQLERVAPGGGKKGYKPYYF